MKKKLTEKELALTKRVGSLRNLTGLSRRAFSERYGIASGTLQHWEIGSPTISLSGATRLIKALQSGGIHCSLDWLLQGLGKAPELPLSLSKVMPHQLSTPHEADRENQLIAEELKLFHKHYPDAIDCVVSDDGMQPLYHPGDVLAGIRHYGADIEKIIGLDCIIFTKDSDLLLRQLRKSPIHSHYNLACINPHTRVEKPVLYEVAIVSAAPVVWLRRGTTAVGATLAVALLD